jgi:hypothetical protein
MKPAIIPPNYDGIPQELRALHIWLLWVLLLVKKRWTKVPKIADGSGRCAATNRPETWRPYGEAVAHAPQASGIGMCFTGSYCGIDLDRCRDKSSKIAPWAQRVVALVDSYTEISPSGEGLHIIVKLTKPLPEGARLRGGKEKAGWEIAIYDQTSPRYFCVTGVVIDEHDRIRVCDPAEFFPLFERGELDPPAAKSKGNGHAGVNVGTSSFNKRERLLRGEWEGLGYPSQSEADLAFCAILAADLNGDAQQIDQAFRASGMFRPKWDERHGAGTYGEITIARAIGKTEETRKNPAGPAGEEREYPVWPSDPDPAAFYGLAGDYVRAVEPHTEASPLALLVQFLLDFGSVVGRNAYFPVESDKHYANENAVIVGETGKSRKGTSESRVRSAYSAVDPLWAQNRIAGGLSSGEGLIWAVRDAIFKREPIREKKRVVDYQDVITDPGVLDKRLLVVESEFASPLRMTERDGNTLSPIVRQAWDGTKLQTLVTGRVHSVPVATGAHVSIIGHITVDELRCYLSVTEQGNGFANRFLWFCVRRSSFLPEGGDLEACARAILPIVERLKAAIEFGKKARVLKRSVAARKEWAAIYRGLSEGRPGLLGAVTSRAEAHVTRLSLIYALLDQSELFESPHQDAALALWQHCEASCKFIFGDSLGDPVADTILTALRSAPDGMTRTELGARLGRHQPAGAVSRALDSLLALNLVRRETRLTEGRSAEVWFAI